MEIDALKCGGCERIFTEQASDAASLALITQMSPVAWQHINFYGWYEFTKGPEPINVEVIVESLAR